MIQRKNSLSGFGLGFDWFHAKLRTIYYVLVSAYPKFKEIFRLYRKNSYDQIFIAALFLFVTIQVFSCGIRKSTKIANAFPPDLNRGELLIVYPPEAASLRTKYAAILGVNSEDIGEPRVYAFIDQWLGTPYHTGGNSHAGTDCSGFSQNLYRTVFNIQIPRTSSDQAEKIIEVDKAQLKEGDLIFFSSTQNKIDHVGVYLHNGKFVHASTSRGVVISDLNQNWYQRNYIKGGSFSNF